MNNALEESSARLQALLDSSPAFIYFKDCQSNYQTANKALANLLGIEENEFKGKTDYDLFPKKQAEFNQQCDQQIMDSGVPIHNLEESIMGKDWNSRRVITTKLPYRNADGLIIGIVSTMKDITNSQLAEEKLRAGEERFRKIFEEL